MHRNPLMRHLDEAGEGYGEHCGKAAGFGLRTGHSRMPNSKNSRPSIPEEES